MTEYVLGFNYDKAHELIILIEKNHPEIQRGKFNGIGGKIEEGEDHFVAMRREYKEETGLVQEDWKRIGTISGKDHIVYVFEGETDFSSIVKPSYFQDRISYGFMPSPTPEEVYIIDRRFIGHFDCMHAVYHFLELIINRKFSEVHLVD